MVEYFIHTKKYFTLHGKSKKDSKENEEDSEKVYKEDEEDYEAKVSIVF